MIFGIGTDIVSFPRISELHERYGMKFARRILSDIELEEYQSHAQQARMLMKRFAAKEALSKALGTGLRHPVGLREISITHDELGKPVFDLSVLLENYIEKLGVSGIHLSISDEREHAVAFVVLERSGRMF